MLSANNGQCQLLRDLNPATLPSVTVSQIAEQSLLASTSLITVCCARQLHKHTAYRSLLTSALFVAAVMPCSCPST